MVDAKASWGFVMRRPQVLTHQSMTYAIYTESELDIHVSEEIGCWGRTVLVMKKDGRIIRSDLGVADTLPWHFPESLALFFLDIVGRWTAHFEFHAIRGILQNLETNTGIDLIRSSMYNCSPFF